MKKIIVYLLPISFTFLIIACSAATGTRYGNKNEKESDKTKTKNTKELTENFNIKPYRTKIDIPKTKSEKNNEELNVWYDYKTKTDTSGDHKTVVEKVNGYRVQVLSTDNLDSANTVRSEIYFKTNQKAVYVEFEPPFYKVKVGDFTDLAEAKNLAFKLSQMGYTEARVVNEQVNVFK